MLLSRYQSALRLATLPMMVQGVVQSDRSRVHPNGAARIWRLALQFMANQSRVVTASTPYEHLLMAASIMSVPEQTGGCVVECGCYQGGSAVNLSLVCRLVRRRLLLFDSFAGLPSPESSDAAHRLGYDKVIHTYERGMYEGPLDLVRSNLERFGAAEVCDFRVGWFEHTLDSFDEPCILAFVDVDLRDSLETCVRAIWPRLLPGCSMFVHEAPHHEIASLFFDEQWWRSELGSPAPGLAGAGTGIGLTPSVRGWISPLGVATKLTEGDYRQQRG